MEDAAHCKRSYLIYCAIGLPADGGVEIVLDFNRTGIAIKLVGEGVAVGTVILTDRVPALRV
jgi:hypothetical protein